MNQKPPFDPLRAAFWLIAMVIFVEMVVVVTGALTCLIHADLIVQDPNIKCDPDNRLAQLLSAALAAALALYARAKGNGNGDGDKHE